MQNHPYITFAHNGENISIRVSQLKNYINRIKLPKFMQVQITSGGNSELVGTTSEDGFFILFDESSWPEDITRPTKDNIVQIPCSKIKYWQEYELADEA